MRNVKSVLAVDRCRICKRDLLTSVIAVPREDNILFVQYSKFCSVHGTVTSISKEEILK